MLKFIDGFDQFQLQSGSALLASLTAAGYVVSTGLVMAAGRHESTYALEMQVSAGAAGGSWSLRTNSIKNDLRGIATNDAGRWIAVGDAGSATVSSDTITWTPLVTGVPAQLNSIDCNNGRWIAVGANGTIIVSTDNGLTWAVKTSPLPTAVLNAIHYDDNKWVVAGAQGSAGAILTSTDNGDTWSYVADNAGAQANQAVYFGNGKWMIAGNGGQVLTSTTGLTWTSLTSGVSSQITDITHGNGTWAFCTQRTIRYSLTDGATWLTATTEVGPTNVTLDTIAFAAGRWLAAGYPNYMGTSDDLLTWTTRVLTGTVSSNTIYELGVSAGPDAALLAVGTRNGGYPSSTAIIFASLAPPTTLQRTYTSLNNKVVIGFAHRATARGRILSIANVLDMEWPGPIQILGQSSVAVPIRNAWYYYELVIDKVANTVQLFVNDTADMIATLPGSAAAVTDYVVTWQAENGAVARLDDFYFLDGDATGGATLVNRLRPIRIPLRLPTADVDIEWSGSAEVPHWSLVGVLPPDAGNYIRSAETGAHDLFSSSTPLPAGSGAVLAVGVLALAKKSDLDNRQLGLVVGSGASQLEVIDTTLNTSPEYSGGIFEKAPGGGAWDATNIVSTPFGVVVRP